MSVNLAVKYKPNLDQAFTHDSYTEKFVNRKYDFDGVATVNAYTVTTVAPTNYNRTETGDRFGGNNELQDVITPYTLTNDKAFKIVIDRGNFEQGALAKKAGEVLKAEMNEQIIPIIDKDRLATAKTAADAVTQAVTATDDAYADVLAMEAFLDEAKAPVEGRAMFVTPAFYNALKTKIVTNMHVDKYASELIGRGFVGELDGVPVVKVPTSYFPNKTKALLWHRDAMLGAKQIMKTRIITDSELVDGSVLVGRFIYGSFALNGKKKGFASVVEA